MDSPGLPGASAANHMGGMTSSLPLFPEDTPPLVSGFRYREKLFDDATEADLISKIATLPFAPFAFKGFTGLRQTIAFGSGYDFTHNRVEEAQALPSWLEPLWASAGAFAGVDPAVLAQTLVSEYQPGAGIGWHRDRPDYDKVVGISLGSSCVLRLRRPDGARWIRRNVGLARRSAYVLDGEVRDVWQHSILPGDHLRYSVTFRNYR